MKRLWYKISQIGIDDSVSHMELRYISLMNEITVLRSLFLFSIAGLMTLYWPSSEIIIIVIPSKNITNFSFHMKEQIACIDQQVSGEQRMFHMQQYLQGSYVYKNNNTIEGFYLPSFEEGLIIANTRSAGIELMKMRLASKVDVVFPSNNLIAAEFMDKNNYNITKKAKRMRLGMKRTVLLANIYNRIGGDIG